MAIMKEAQDETVEQIIIEESVIVEKNKKITGKQSLFIEEYLIDLNAARAAIAAGYSENNAAAAGFRNLQIPAISEIIKARKNETALKLNITRESILRDLELIKAGNFDENPSATLKAIEIQIKMLGLNEPEKTETKITGLSLKDMIRFTTDD